MNKYYWQGFLNKYEVHSFTYDEDDKKLYLYDNYNRIIVELSFNQSDVDLSTFTDDEINDYLLQNFEEYIYLGGK
jgi:hypothetical protein